MTLERAGSTMRFSVIVIAVALLLPDATNAIDHLIRVGPEGGLVFDPTDITAAAGDTISFQFQSTNHSVTQSTFATPCVRQTTPSLGVSSEFMLVAAGDTVFPEWSITVNNSTAPLWFFCAQTNPVSHCNQGMVFSVNAPSHQTFAQFQAAAKAGGGQTGPVAPTTDSNPFSSSSSFSSISSTTAAPTDSTAPTTTASVSTPVESITTPTPTTSGPSSTSARSGDSNGQTTNKSKNIGPIVGGIVGGLMIIALAIVACIYQHRRKRPRKSIDLDLAADSDSPLVVPFRSMPFRTAKRFLPSNTDITPRMVMHEDSGVRLPPIGERIFVPVVDVPPRYTSG